MACSMKKSMTGGKRRVSRKSMTDGKRKTSKKGSKKPKSKGNKKSKLGPNQAFCVKCHKIVTMVDGHEESYKKKGGKTGKMMKGKCPKCGTKVNRIMSG